MIVRVLHDAASPGVREWEAGDGEMEEAALTVALLALLGPSAPAICAGPETQEAVYRLCSRFFTLSARSGSPAVMRLQAAREAGSLSSKEQRSFLR
jgi:hypothetical protein